MRLWSKFINWITDREYHLKRTELLKDIYKMNILIMKENQLHEKIQLLKPKIKLYISSLKTHCPV